jgi:cytoskeleton protein RodZ
VQLKLPSAIVEAMERDDHGQLGAPVFARGRLSSYARLLGVPAGAVEEQFAQALAAPPALVVGAHGSRIEHGQRRFARQGVCIVLAATVALPVVWFAIHNQSLQPRASLASLDGTSIAAHKSSNPAISSVNAEARKARGESPVIASIAPLGSYGWSGSHDGGGSAATVTGVGNVPDATHTGLQLRFSGDSSVDIVGVDGRVIEHDTVEAGSVRNYQTAAVASVEIGNPGAVLVLRNGEPLDLRPFHGADATRFTLSSDGKPAPVRD